MLVAIVPRVLLGVIAGALYAFCHKKGLSVAISAACSALVATILHTIGVLGLIILFYASPYAEAIGVAQSALMAAMGTVILTNAIPETIVAVVANMALAKALSMKR